MFRLLERLPSLSRYKKAIADDDEVALRMHEEDQAAEAAGKPRVRRELSLREWSEEREQTADLMDQLGVIAWLLQAANSKKTPPKPKPVRRPVTARDRVEKAAERETYEDIVSLIAPHEARKIV